MSTNVVIVNTVLKSTYPPCTICWCNSVGTGSKVAAATNYCGNRVEVPNCCGGKVVVAGCCGGKVGADNSCCGGKVALGKSCCGVEAGNDCCGTRVDAAGAVYAEGLAEAWG